MKLGDLFRLAYGRPTPPSSTDWHPWSTVLPVRTVTGGWTMGDVERRRGPCGRWEYRAREETDEEWADRQW